ncbi:shikimate kinase [bacterium]|nr:shikimate kinase [bacterium]
MNNLNLVGYRCSGKSSVGRKLADTLQLPFVDADIVFVEQTEMTITEFVAKFGWHKFRCIESEILNTLCLKESIVLATGGGVVLDPGNCKLLHESGICFWLRVVKETVFSRLKADSMSTGQRPALSSLNLADEISAGFKEREPFYREIADHTISADKLSVAEIAEQIVSELRTRGVS